MKKRVLFVDDEPRVLEGLQRMLRGQRHAWDMGFALGGDAALEACADTPYDVIVTDMRMPGMDGASLLATVQARYPDTVRLVLSGHTDRDAAARAAQVAHLFLAKPCGAEFLRAAVDRACSLRGGFAATNVRSVVGSVDTLPAVPEVFARLQQLAATPDTTVDTIAAVLVRDPGLCAKILHLVNSSFFGFARVASIRSAISLLGTNMVKYLALSTDVFRAFPNAAGVRSFSLEALQQHSELVGGLAMRCAADPVTAEEACVAGMLHDVGKLVIAERLPAELDGILDTARRHRLPLHVAESEVLGVNHAEVGAYLLGLWGLPDTLVGAVARHHVGADGHTFEPPPAGLVRVANALAHEVEEPVAQSRVAVTPDALGEAEPWALESLPRWREVARALAMEPRGSE